MEASASAEIEHRNRDKLEIKIQEMLAEPYGPGLPSLWPYYLNFLSLEST
jgi:hypothetical protein